MWRRDRWRGRRRSMARSPQFLKCRIDWGASSPARRAAELQPRSARAWRELGAELMILGHDSEGMPALRKALALDPEDATIYGAMGRAFFISYARFREAADWLDRALEKNPNAGWYS